MFYIPKDCYGEKSFSTNRNLVAKNHAWKTEAFRYKPIENTLDTTAQHFIGADVCDHAKTLSVSVTFLCDVCVDDQTSY